MLQRRQLAALSGLAVLILGILSQVLWLNAAEAAQITTRSLTLQAGTSDGGSKPLGVVNHYFQFTLPTTGANSLGSIKFLYCTLPGAISDPCTTPTGLSTTGGGVTLDDTGSGITGWTLTNTTNGAPYVHLASAASPGSATNMKIKLLAVTNPDGTSCGGSAPANHNCTFFVRIASYASLNTTGSVVDAGTVAASTAEPIVLTGTMPESLVFCTGGTVSTVSSVPDCTTATSGAVSFNQLFSPTSTAIATSQMAASTNAGFGYIITVNGTTLTSGSNTITANAAATTSILGTGQFGMNLRANTTPTVGTDVAPAANGTNFKGEPAPASGYQTVDQFKFVSGNTVADSANGGAGGTDAQIFTVSYIVNVPGSQPAGLYTTTLTYICTPTF